MTRDQAPMAPPLPGKMPAFSLTRAERLAQAMTLHLPDPAPTPLVVSVPHAGTAVLDLGDPLADTLDVRCDGDLHVDALYAGSPRGAFIVAHLSRFVCDLNRHPDDVTATAVPDHPAPVNQTGRGFIWQVTTAGSPALSRALSMDEWNARREIHAAYHGAIATALQRARTRFGYAILLDGHSMPSQGRTGHTDSGRRRAAFVPGDRKGHSCGAAVSKLVGAFFRARGFDVAFNDPYQGGFITQHHGRPRDGIHAIQLEMRRDLYMDEATYAGLSEPFAQLREHLAALVAALETLDPRSAD